MWNSPNGRDLRRLSYSGGWTRKLPNVNNWQVGMCLLDRDEKENSLVLTYYYDFLFCYDVLFLMWKGRKQLSSYTRHEIKFSAWVFGEYSNWKLNLLSCVTFHQYLVFRWPYVQFHTTANAMKRILSLDISRNCFCARYGIFRAENWFHWVSRGEHIQLWDVTFNGLGREFSSEKPNPLSCRFYLYLSQQQEAGFLRESIYSLKNT